jgi:hypothetical protein
MKAMTLVATRRKVVRKSARDWPQKSCEERRWLVGGSCWGFWCVVY